MNSTKLYLYKTGTHLEGIEVKCLDRSGVLIFGRDDGIMRLTGDQLVGVIEGDDALIEAAHEKPRGPVGRSVSEAAVTTFALPDPHLDPSFIPAPPHTSLW